MLARDALRLHANRCQTPLAWVGRASEVLSALDPSARLLDPVAALASLAVVGRLRELLPDELLACRFGSLAEQDEAGAALIDRFGAGEPVTLHLGYGPVAFAVRLGAAWTGWREFCDAGVDAHNACLYPTGLGWYVVRAGGRFMYPMDCESGEQPRLAVEWLRH